MIMTDKKIKELKQALWMKGYDAISDFLGYEYDKDEDEDVTDTRIDDVLDQIPEEEFELFYNKYAE